MATINSIIQINIVVHSNTGIKVGCSACMLEFQTKYKSMITTMSFIFNFLIFNTISNTVASSYTQLHREIIARIFLNCMRYYPTNTILWQFINVFEIVNVAHNVSTTNCICRVYFNWYYWFIVH